jgi:hypothetical protein
MSENIRTQVVEFKKGAVIELSFATIKNGMESQLFNDYFPQVMPIVTEIGGQPLGSFKIRNTTDHSVPKMCALFQWPSIDSFQKLHDDTRFLAIKSIRDTALSYFVNGMFFTIKEDTKISFVEDKSVALRIVNSSDVDDNNSIALVSMESTTANVEENITPQSLNIVLWDVFAERQLAKPSVDINLYELAMNFPT